MKREGKQETMEDLYISSLLIVFGLILIESEYKLNKIKQKINKLEQIQGGKK